MHACVQVSAAKTEAAEFIRDGLFTLGPTFVKLGQVTSHERTNPLEQTHERTHKQTHEQTHLNKPTNKPTNSMHELN